MKLNTTSQKEKNKKKVLYLFRRPVQNDIKASRKGKYPQDFFYGLTKIGNKFSVITTDKVFKRKIAKSLDFLVIKLLYNRIKTGLSFFSVLSLKKEIDNSNLTFTTVDSYGLPYAFLKSVKIINTPFIFNTIGLCDSLIESKSLLFKAISKKVLKSASHILSGASYLECKKLSSILDISITKFSFIPFGIDTVYFHPKKIKKFSSILIIGADPKRDWKTYRKVINALPKIKFVIITNKVVFSNPPQNVRMLYNLPIGVVRDYIWKSRLVLILSKQNYHFAGQSTILRSMSCAKTVVFTKSYGTGEYGFIDSKNSIMVPPGDHKAIVVAIKGVYKSNGKLEQIGTNARKLILKKYDIKNYSKLISKVFEEVLKNTNENITDGF